MCTERIEEQRLEIEKKNLKLGALQRNFENMSKIPDNSVEQADLQKRFQKIARELADVTKACHEKSAQVDSLRAELVELKASKGEADSLSSSNQALESKIHQLEADLKKTLNISKTRLNKLGEANKQVTAMQHQVEQCSAQVSNARDIALNAEKKTAIAEASAATNEKEMWAQQAKASHALQEAERLEAGVADLQRTKMQHQMRVMELEGEVDAASRAREALSRSSAEERKALQQELEGLKGELAGLKGELAESKGRHFVLEAEIAQLREGAGQSSQQDKVALQLAQQEAMRLQGELEDAQADKMRLKNEVDILKGSMAGNDVLKEELEALRAKELEWLKEKQHLSRLQEAEHRDVLKLKEEINGLENELLESSEELRRARDEFEAKLSEAEKEMKEKQKLNHEELRLLQQKYDALKEDANGLDKKKLGDALAKMNNAQEAMEGVLTCMNCMEVYQGPMTYIPCGHTFCKECVESSKDRNGGSYSCDECGSTKPVKSVTANALIDEVAGKFTYQKQVLASLQKHHAKTAA